MRVIIPIGLWVLVATQFLYIEKIFFDIRCKNLVISKTIFCLDGQARNCVDSFSKIIFIFSKYSVLYHEQPF